MLATRKHWQRHNHCPHELRKVSLVLAEAKPALDGAHYRWWCAGSDWWGVVPAEGIIPAEICGRMAKRSGFRTAEEAMDALRLACDGLVLNSSGYVVSTESQEKVLPESSEGETD